MASCFSYAGSLQSLSEQLYSDFSDDEVRNCTYCNVGQLDSVQFVIMRSVDQVGFNST